MRVSPSQLQEEQGKCILSRPVAKKEAGRFQKSKELCKTSKESVVLSEVGEGKVKAGHAVSLKVMATHLDFIPYPGETTKDSLSTKVLKANLIL